MRLLSTGGGDFHGSILPPSLCFTLTCLLLFYASASSSISEKSVLLELKSSVSDPEGVLSSWISRNSSDGLEHCSWYGVVCGADSRVSALTVGGGGNWGFGSNLEKVPFVDAFKYPFYDSGAGRTSSGGRNGRLIGALPSAVAKLTEIRVLSLPSLGFTGEIPAEIWGLQKLEVLNLEGNSFTGNLPVSFEGLRKLRVLNLGFNQIGGGIPDLLSRCVKLEVLNLAGNRFRGPIPKFIGRFPKLSGLLLSKNNLTGEIPHTFGQLQKLKLLDVSSNSLSGPVPGELGKCTDLSVLVLSGSGNGKGNSFQGTIPTEITSLLKLKVLWAPGASLKGEFPSNWGESLEVLNLSHNFFTGELIRVFEVCKSLIYVDLSSNKLTGPLDRKLHVPCMVVFDVSKNMFSGAIPRFSNGGVCPPVNLPKVLYLQQFDDAPTVNVKLAVIHNFGQNNFTGAIPSLPIARSRLVESADYAFLADGNKLTGSFPGRLFESCHKLNGMFVKVNNNRLSGRVPVALGAMCRSLKFLDASGNRISGFIPQSLGDKESMVLVDLQQKDGHAEIPVHLGWLNRLYYYSLSKDMLQGVLPCRLRRFLPVKVFSLDSGSLGIENLPGGTMELRNLTAVVFNFNELSLQIHTDLSDGKPLARRVLSDATDVQTDPVDGSGNGAKFNSIEIASIVSASAIVLVLLALIVLFIYTRKYAPKGGSRVQVLEKREITTFTNIGVSLTFQNIVKATESFSTRNCIGSGGFGTTYRAEVSPGVLVAVKRLAVGRFHCVQQFHAEIKTLGGIRHQNLVTLIGYHASETEMFLVYNYLPGGNLEKFIKDRSTRPVSWKVLHKIALDVAHALAYLHDSCDQRIIHRDVKPSNILLDNDFNAYLSDFGLSRLLGDSETHATTGVEGTFGYLAPEYAMTCRVSEKADVYSYGVVLLELISDKKALDPSFSAHGDGFNIVSWACMLLRQGRAKEVFTTGLWDSGPRDDLVEVLHLAVKCTLETLSIRPTMKQVVSRLKQLRPVS